MISFLNKLRFLFLKPDSRLELWLRTQYHRLMGTRLVFKIQDWAARRSYQKFRKIQQNKPQFDGKSSSEGPKVSFLLAWDEAQVQACLNTLSSIQNLDGETWDLVLFVSDEGVSTRLPNRIKGDQRIQTIISTDRFKLDRIIGQFLLICQPGDQFNQHLLSCFYEILDKGIPVDLTYYDSETLDEVTGTFLPHFKPAGFSTELMLSVNYLSHGIVKRDLAVEILEQLNPLQDLLAQEYDLNLKMLERKCAFEHIPKVLVTQAGLVTPNNAEIRKVILEHLSRLGLTKAGYVEATSGTRFTWDIGDPSLTVVILTKNNRTMLKTLLASMQTDLINHNAMINIVDNGSNDRETLAYYKKLAQEPIISIIPYKQPFNYSEAINLGVRESNSDLVLLLNDDMQMRDPDLLEELMRWAARPEVGVVGTKLIRANHTIQHAGIIMGLSGFAGHIYLNASEHYEGLFGSVDWYRDYLALTGACQMLRREVFDEVGGYDEGYQLAFGDIDFCLRVHEHGYRNVYTPFASMYHFEGQTRGYVTPTRDVLRGMEEMEPYLVDEDPYYSPNLTYTRIPKCNTDNDTQEKRLIQIKTRQDFYQ